MTLELQSNGKKKKKKGNKIFDQDQDQRKVYVSKSKIQTLVTLMKSLRDSIQEIQMKLESIDKRLSGPLPTVVCLPERIETEAQQTQIRNKSGSFDPDNDDGNSLTAATASSAGLVNAEDISMGDLKAQENKQIKTNPPRPRAGKRNYSTLQLNSKSKEIINPLKENTNYESDDSVSNLSDSGRSVSVYSFRSWSVLSPSPSQSPTNAPTLPKTARPKTNPDLTETKRILGPLELKEIKISYSDKPPIQDEEKTKIGHRSLNSSNSFTVKQNNMDVSSTALSPTILYHCPTCNKLFKRKTRFDEHLERHLNQKPFQCEACAKIFSTANSLREHSRIHSGFKPYKCTRCSRAFTHRASLNSHNNFHEVRTATFNCSTCNECFFRSGDLAKHKNSPAHKLRKEKKSIKKYLKLNMTQNSGLN